MGSACCLILRYWKIQTAVFSLLFIMGLGCSSQALMQVGLSSTFLQYSHAGLSLALLTIFLVPTYYLASVKPLRGHGKSPETFSFLIKLLTLILLLFFLSSSTFLFYFFFEAALIPTFLLILGWGYQPERVQAGLYLLLYTVTGSLPLLLVLCYSFSQMSTSLWSFSWEWLYSLSGLSKTTVLAQSAVYTALILAFLFKLPLYGAHVWLPKAHVEAPVAGSMVLAGVLLKLGGYGLLCVLPLLKSDSWQMSFFAVLGMWGGLLASLVCLTQVDMKSLVAYSSIGHMAFVLVGILSFYKVGQAGAVLVMIAHGLCSAGLFALCSFNYEGTGSRSLLLNRGGLTLSSSLALWWALLCCCNMSSPPSLNLLGEAFIYPSILGISMSLVIVAACISFLAMAFSFYLFSATQHGPLSNQVSVACTGHSMAYTTLFMLWVPLNLFLLQNGFLIC